MNYYFFSMNITSDMYTEKTYNDFDELEEMNWSQPKKDIDSEHIFIT